MTLKKELNKSFDFFLDQILECFDVAYPVAVRAKAMRCLSQIIDVDHQILAIVIIFYKLNKPTAV